jgi:hypothetical protein
MELLMRNLISARMCFRRLVPGLLALAVASCGGGGGGADKAANCLPYTTDTTCATNTGSKVVTQLALTVDTPAIQTDGSSVVTIKAALKDSSNAVVTGENVSFAVSSGTLLANSATTDTSTGVATVTFNSDDNKSNRTVTVTASYQSLVKTTTIAIQGTRLGFGGDSSGVIDTQVSMTVSLLDGAGKAIANQDVVLSSKLGNAVPATVKTDSSGLATITFTPRVGGADTITATALGASASKDLTVSSIDFAFTSPATGVSFPINGCSAVTAQLLTGVSATGATFTSSRGSVYSDSACTSVGSNSAVDVAFTGTTATAYVKSPSAGAATVSAILKGGAAAGTTARRELKFVSLVPTQMVIQSDPSTLSPNSTANVYAVVRDNSGNPVSGSTIIFTAPNGGGTANPSIAYTDDSGIASTTFKADPNLTGKDSVLIEATINGFSVTDTATLTVAGQGVNMVISTDNLLVKDVDPPRYRAVWGVYVTDTAGNPVKNQAVTISLRAVAFKKGYYYVPTTGTSAGKWTVFEADECPAEDANNDGFFQTGEIGDFNHNGRYEPNGSALVMPPVLSSAQATSVVVTTDNSGTAAFWVVYPPNYAHWAKIELTATAAVAGRNNSASRSYYLPVLASELSSADISPSFQTSPFGIEPSCASPD